MEKTNKYYSIIEKLVRQHKKFPGYEAIIEDIIDDVYSHSEVIINSINNENVINAYLEKVISTSIITVPKKLNYKQVSTREKVNTDFIDKMINNAYVSDLPPKQTQTDNLLNDEPATFDKKEEDLFLAESSTSEPISSTETNDILAEFIDNQDSIEPADSDLNFTANDTTPEENDNLNEQNPAVNEIEVSSQSEQTVPEDTLIQPSENIVDVDDSLDLADDNNVTEVNDSEIIQDEEGAINVPIESVQEQTPAFDEPVDSIDLLDIVSDTNTENEHETASLFSEESLSGDEHESMDEIVLDTNTDEEPAVMPQETVDEIELSGQEPPSLGLSPALDETTDDIEPLDIALEAGFVEEPDVVSQKIVDEIELSEQDVPSLEIDETLDEIPESSEPSNIDIDSNINEEPVVISQETENDVELDEQEVSSFELNTALDETTDELDITLDSSVDAEPAFLSQENVEEIGLNTPEDLQIEQSTDIDLSESKDSMELSLDNDNEYNLEEDLSLAEDLSEGNDLTLSLDDSEEYDITPLNDSQDGVNELDNSESLEPAKSDDETNSPGIDYSMFDYEPQSEINDVDIEEISKELMALNNKRQDLNIIKVFELKYKENLSVQEIALQLEMSESSVLEALNEIIAVV